MTQGVVDYINVLGNNLNKLNKSHEGKAGLSEEQSGPRQRKDKGGSETGSRGTVTGEVVGGPPLWSVPLLAMSPDSQGCPPLGPQRDQSRVGTTGACRDPAAHRPPNPEPECEPRNQFCIFLVLNFTGGFCCPAASENQLLKVGSFPLRTRH